MNIHEYQGKSILKSFGVAIQEGIVAETPEQAVAAAKELKEKYNNKKISNKAMGTVTFNRAFAALRFSNDPP